jgi:hypothetical protein
VAALRKENPAELAAACALVKLHPGTQRQWRLKAQAVRDKQLAGLVGRRKASGSAREILVLRLGLLVAPIVPPAYIVATDHDNIVKLVVVGAIFFAAALTGGHFLTIRARVPVMPKHQGPLAERTPRGHRQRHPAGHPAEQGRRTRPPHHGGVPSVNGPILLSQISLVRFRGRRLWK